MTLESHEWHDGICTQLKGYVLVINGEEQRGKVKTRGNTVHLFLRFDFRTSVLEIFEKKIQDFTSRGGRCGHSVTTPLPPKSGPVR